MIVFLWCIYLLAAVVRLSWWMLFRQKISVEQSTSGSREQNSSTGISIVVCSYNNCAGLQQLLPSLVQQHYPLFEIILVNDRSTDQTASWLEAQRLSIPQLKVVTIEKTPVNWNSKKHALTQGIRQAQYPLLALTDSDCVPLSNQWLRHLAEKLSQPGIDIFLGYSPYATEQGLLNKIIQTETLFTALQYFALANSGMAYMGVGRNLGYKKDFLENHLDAFPFQNHLGGDDDLLINQLSTGKDAVACTNQESFVQTFPPNTWSAWWKQKRRHLSAGKRYKPTIKWLLSTYWISASWFWLTFFLLMALTTSEDLVILLFVQSLFFCAATAILYPVFRIFKAGSLLPLFLFWDFLYIASSSIIGFSTFLVKNKKWS
ncbi:MAG: glycosyl transferase family 2 [Chitinophagaceae bacterium]|nr:glycosyl transferase family 2 [Chitinophagaceae bacterium]